MKSNPPSQAKTAAAPARPKFDFDKTYTFRVRRHTGKSADGTFGGLWELTLLDEKGNVTKTLADADALVYCLENVQGELENEGF